MRFAGENILSAVRAAVKQGLQRAACLRACSSLLLRARVLEVTPDPPGRAREDDDADEEVEAVEPGLERFVLVPLLAEHLADVGEAEAPRQRAEEGVDGEARQVHARHSRGEG